MEKRDIDNFDDLIRYHQINRANAEARQNLAIRALEILNKKEFSTINKRIATYLEANGIRARLEEAFTIEKRRYSLDLYDPEIKDYNESREKSIRAYSFSTYEELKKELDRYTDMELARYDLKIDFIKKNRQNILELAAKMAKVAKDGGDTYLDEDIIKIAFRSFNINL